MRKAMKIVAGIAGALVLLILALAIYLFVTALKPSSPVGYQQAVAAGAGHAPMPVHIWYPTNSEPGFVLAGLQMLRVASDAPVSGSGLPLVVMSHGTGGSPMSHVDTALALAARGFVVAAPVHPGDNFQDDSTVGTPEWLPGRSRDISRAIDFMLSDWKGRSHLDRQRIGVFGFSAGATAALIASGGAPDLERLVEQCRQAPEFVCQLQKPGATLRNPPGGWNHDPRIDAAVLAAPGLGFTFTEEGLANVTIPVQLWAGAGDQTVPYATNSGWIRHRLPRSPEFHSVAGASHYSFLTPCGLLGPPAICRDPAGFDRAQFHQRFNDSVAAFFERHLEARRGAR